MGAPPALLKIQNRVMSSAIRAVLLTCNQRGASLSGCSRSGIWRAKTRRIPCASVIQERSDAAAITERTPANSARREVKKRMKKYIVRLTILACFSFFTTPSSVKAVMSAPAVDVGANSPGSVFHQYIEVCGGGYYECCQTTGGYTYCTWCDEYYCLMITVGCV